MSVIKAWYLIIERYKKGIPVLVPGCYYCLISETISIMYRLQLASLDLSDLYKEFKKVLADTLPEQLQSTSSIKRKIRYIWRAIAPRSYIALFYHKGGC